MTDKLLKSQQIKVLNYQRTIERTLGDMRLMLIGLLGSVYIGWKLAESKSIGQLVKRTIKWAYIVALTTVKSRLISYITQRV